MSGAAAWPVASPISTARLRLEPLRVGHAPETAPVFGDVRLHEWTGGTPCTPAELEARYLRQAGGSSPDGTRGWLNWILRRRSDGRLTGTVQATLPRPHRRLSAQLAWVVGHDHQGNGYGREGARAMVEWLRAHGPAELTAHVHPRHEASNAIARAVGLNATNTVSGGEVRWRSQPASRRR
ncbi:GNAT family N-acetyltransferase [Saccharopolyspora sp. NFXS83]|uniref:GNAT family N-acetyltransferase n=1 Tax=Saccharopolyspora sp. NFXS83 TaxID=2993560 RepID=UPI00224A6C6B|nr:GNAT family N-acetyltransferase [Saccharopolyspora sp. NFXS83]MCX2732607.1 GNAT family N-acetyltransferase [Saccharopolyspora sp. NFXS83]